MGMGVKTLIPAAWKPVFCWKPSDEDVELSAPPESCLPGCCHAPALMIVD
jgi:NADH:ubiquinone oxidoreductase subunit E